MTGWLLYRVSYNDQTWVPLDKRSLSTSNQKDKRMGHKANGRMGQRPTSSHIEQKSYLEEKKITAEIHNTIIISKCLVDLFTGWFYAWKYFDLSWYPIITRLKKNHGGFKKPVCHNGCITVHGCLLELVWYSYISWLFKECLF